LGKSQDGCAGAVSGWGVSIGQFRKGRRLLSAGHGSGSDWRGERGSSEIRTTLSQNTEGEGNTGGVVERTCGDVRASLIVGSSNDYRETGIERGNCTKNVKTTYRKRSQNHCQSDIGSCWWTDDIDSDGHGKRMRRHIIGRTKPTEQNFRSHGETGSPQRREEIIRWYGCRTKEARNRSAISRRLKEGARGGKGSVIPRGSKTQNKRKIQGIIS